MTTACADMPASQNPRHKKAPPNRGPHDLAGLDLLMTDKSSLVDQLNFHTAVCHCCAWHAIEQIVKTVSDHFQP